MIRILFIALAVGLSWRFGMSGQAGEEKGPGISKMPWGQTKEGKPVELFTLTNAKGMIVKITNYGGTVTEIHVPDRAGKFDDVVLGFDNLDDYLKGHPFFGCITGRYANRIAKGKFTLDGKEYTLATNNGPNHLHGGKVGFDKKVWQASTFEERSLSPRFATDRNLASHGVLLRYRSPDGEEGYPGNLDCDVRYVLTDQNELRISYTAKTDKPTVVNLTNHTYFNLAGPKAGDVLGHEMQFFADRYTPVDDTLIPTGEIKPVAGTPFDFSKPMTIGSRIDQLMGDPRGYDHNMIFAKGGKELALGVRVYEPKSGRVMEMLTTEPAVQFYTGNFLDGSAKGKGGVVYQKHHGFCLEAQHYPDSPNQPKFPSVILRPGETYKQTTVYRFSAK